MTYAETAENPRAVSGDNVTSGFAADRLRSYIERIERLEEEKQTYADDIKDVYAEARGNGFDVKAIREIIKRRKQDADRLEEHEMIVQTYLVALGMA